MQLNRRRPLRHPRAGSTRAAWCSVVAGVVVASLIGMASTAGAAAPRVTGKPVLKIGLPYSYFMYYPNITAFADGNSASLEISLAYESLFHMEPNGTIVGELASSGQYTNKAQTGFELTLIHGVRFSDGTPLTAAAVVKYLKFYSTQLGNQATFGVHPEFRAIGKWTVKLKLSTPVRDMTEVLSDVGNNSGTIASPACVANPKLFTNATCGTGPYILKSSVPGTSYTYTPNPHYYDKSAVKYSGVVVDVLPAASSALSALQAGQLNFAYIGSDSSTVSAAKSAGLKVESAPVGTYELLLNEKDPSTSALKRQDVREAISYALNRPALAQLVAPGYAKADDLFPVTDISDPSFQKYYTYDPAKAKALLTAAGYPNGLTLNLALVQARTQDQTMFGGVAQELHNVGITLNPVNFSSTSSITQNAGYLLTMIAGSTESEYQSWLAPTSGSNTWGPAPLLTQLYNKGLHAANPFPAWTKMLEQEAKAAYYVTICSVSGIYYISHSVSGVDVTAPRIGAVFISELSPR
jgi:peptide/nickel transport system substrate-binding protein